MKQIENWASAGVTFESVALPIGILWLDIRVFHHSRVRFFGSVVAVANLLGFGFEKERERKNWHWFRGLLVPGVLFGVQLAFPLGVSN